MSELDKQLNVYKEKLKKFIKFITFVDLPINRKFILFSIGVLFWFLTMFAINFVTNVRVNNYTNELVLTHIPHEKLAQAITRTLEDVRSDMAVMLDATDRTQVNLRLQVMELRLTDLLTFSSTLSSGGEIYYINRDNNQIVESFIVTPIGGDPEREGFPMALKRSAEIQNSTARELALLRTDLLSGALPDQGQILEKADYFNQVNADSLALTDALSDSISRLYALTSAKIKDIMNLSIYLFVGVLLIAPMLLILFSISISRSIAHPVRSIIDQIRALSEGRADFSKDIAVKSKDEIGVLTEEFNYLMDEIQEMTNYKKVIEEDDNLEDVYSRLGKIFTDKFAIDDFIIYEIDNSKNKMKPVYPVLLNEGEIPCNPDVLSNCTMCKAKKTAHTVSSMEQTDICKQFMNGTGKVHVCIPMIISGSAGGVVQFLFDRKYFDRETGDVRIYKYTQYIKESLSVIEAKRLMHSLRESSLKDALTGLYNRRFLQEYSDTLTSGIIRRKKILGLLMCDLDYFKQVNDEYGHNVGDAVLKETSIILKKCVRDSDLVIRFGGEEFLVFLLDTTKGDAIKVAENIRKSVEEAKLKIPNGVINKTISVGVSEFPNDTDSLWQAIKFADISLYKAKESGRNKVIRFTPDMWTEEEF